ncbi:hypothetical protein ACFQ3R_02775 [Mesonia ostreae]|uniref:Uncharacterized protein n=1 Tax=Mesonia ostreae TaxID=861110 RepID=A0ABU2KL82_9FLAO|nr:hypothetical protein [Mesonia ostreae]MDT0295404.1 hypothetical protein [Mesonia ostreae]
MKTNIHYLVEAKYWRREVPNIHDKFSVGLPTEADIAETHTKFEHASPIVARGAAFNHYSSILDVLYDGLEKQRTTDAQARIDLQKYLDSGNALELGNTTKFKTSPDFDKGIEIYLVMENLLKKTEEKFLIHGIRYLDYPERLDGGVEESLQGLIKEYTSYQQNGYEIKNNTEALNLEDVGGEKVTIIKTPFNWQKLVLDYKGYDLCDVW